MRKKLLLVPVVSERRIGASLKTERPDMVPRRHEGRKALALGTSSSTRLCRYATWRPPQDLLLSSMDGVAVVMPQGAYRCVEPR